MHMSKKLSENDLSAVKGQIHMGCKMNISIWYNEFKIMNNKLTIMFGLWETILTMSVKNWGQDLLYNLILNKWLGENFVINQSHLYKHDILIIFK